MGPSEQRHTLVWHSKPSLFTPLLQSHPCHVLSSRRGNVPHAGSPFPTMVSTWSNASSFSGSATCLLSNSLPGLQEVYNYLSSSQGRDYANCWGRQDGGDSTNITHTPTWRPVVTAIPKCGSFHQSSTVSFSWRGKTHTLPSRNKRKRPGSYNVLGGCVFNGLKDFYEGLPLPRTGSEKMGILKPGHLERPYPLLRTGSEKMGILKPRYLERSYPNHSSDLFIFSFRLNNSIPTELSTVRTF